MILKILSGITLFFLLRRRSLMPVLPLLSFPMIQVQYYMVDIPESSQQ